MLPEEQARIKIDKQLNTAGWNIVSRNDYVPMNTCAVKEALMQGNIESDYLLFIDNKAIAVVEAKKEENDLGDEVAEQAENYACHPQNWYGLWFDNQIPLVYLANGKKIYFKNMLVPDSEYVELTAMHSPKKMLQLINKTSEYGALPRLDPNGLRDCQYDAEITLEESLKAGKKKSLAVLATGSGKTYLACLASYRMLNYTHTNRVLFLVDRNNLARQTESEFSLFDRTEKNMPMSSLYQINRLRHEEDVNGNIVISTIQKLYAVLTGQAIIDDDEDAEDEKIQSDKIEQPIDLGNDLKLPRNHFQFIVVDECHRSIYGKWKSVLDYFNEAKVLGLTATPTPEAYAFFNNNVVEKYTYEESVVDGVNVPFRIYKIKTKTTIHGGTIEEGEDVKITTKAGQDLEVFHPEDPIEYTARALDYAITNPAQIETVLREYRDSIYRDLYPDREPDWRYIPKTLIFAKDDHHADKILEGVKKVFAEVFPDEELPENYAQKITYSAGDSNTKIRDFRIEKDFRIAITVTLVATGTDIRPLEVVMFMKNVLSDVLYTQMKGRGCRTITDDKLQEVTPNAESKECYYIVDAVDVTSTEKIMVPNEPNSKRTISLDHLLERLAHGELSDENLTLLKDYLSNVTRKYENNPLFGKHLDAFIVTFGFAPKGLANDINIALEKGILPPYISPSEPNFERRALIDCLISNLPARKKLIEMKKGYYAIVPDAQDEVIFSGFTKESAMDFISHFEKYINEHKDEIEALRIIYNSTDEHITFSMLQDLQEKLIAENRQFTPYYIWENYKNLDAQDRVDELNVKQNVNALTHLIQIVRYAYGKITRLTSLFGTFAQRFNLYCGQAQRELSPAQQQILREIAEYVVNSGELSAMELNQIDTDLWKDAIVAFGQALQSTMSSMAQFILKAA